MTEDARSNPVASAGKIHMLDLSALKARLGHKWDRMAEHVQMFFEAAIRRSIAPGDTYCRFEELSYIVMFRNLSAAEAEIRCAAISEEVCRRLFGENGESVSLRNLVAHVGLAKAPTGSEQQAALDSLLEREGKECVITRQGVAAPAVNDEATIALRAIVGGGPLRRQRIALQDITFVYRPIWDLTTQVVLTYLCQPSANLAASSIAASTGLWTAEGEAEQTVLDLHILHECLDRAHRLRTEGLRVILAIPVHFATISRARSWRDYSQLLQQVSEETRRDLAFVVFGIDHGVPNVRLSQELPKLSRLAYRIFCVAERNQGTGSRFAKTGTHAIGTILDEKDDESQSAARMSEIAREAKAAAIDSFVLGLRSTSLALKAIHSGLRYLEGPIVRPAVEDPRHGFSHGVEDLYRAKRVSA